MNRFIILFFSLITSFSLYAQDEVVIKGKITDKTTYEPVPFVNIINATKGTGVSSDIDGKFLIKIDEGDSLIFSAVGYSRYSLVVTKDLAEAYVTISLDASSMELKTVNVFAYKDLAALKNAVINMDMPIAESEQIAMNLPNPSSLPSTSDGQLGASFGGILSGAINGLGLNKEYNEKMKYQKLLEQDRNKNLVKEKYNAFVLKQWTDLRDEEIEQFIKFCNLSDEFILKATEYDLAIAVNQCVDDFRKQED